MHLPVVSLIPKPKGRLILRWKKQVRHLSALSVMLLLAVTAFLLPQSASAIDSSGCSEYSEFTEYGAEIQMPRGDYGVYAKLGKRGMVANVSVSGVQSGECREISSSSITSEKWHKIAAWTASGSNEHFFLASESLAALPDANRPTLLFVPNQSPPCEPDTECIVKYSGISGVVKPISTDLSENSLQIVKVVDPSLDSLNKVSYFVDNRFMYSTTGFEKFDTRYVPGGSHKISRVASFNSGQNIDFSETIEQSYLDGLNSFLFTAFKYNFRVIIIFVVCFGVAISSYSLLWIIRFWHKRRLWKQNHGFGMPRAEPEEKISGVGDPNVLLAKPHIAKEDSFLVKMIQIIGVVSLVLTISWTITNITDSYLVGIAKVSGISMQNTFDDNQRLAVNKLGVSFEKVRNGKFIPKRGEIVFVKRSASSSQELKISKYLVKRVIGLPGDRLEVRNGKITIFNKDFPNGFNPDEGSNWQQNIIVDNSENLDIVLGNDELFVVGDNRPQSIDSRFNGAIRSDEIVGTTF